MSNNVLLSAMTMIALTGITLTTLKYRHDSHNANVTLVLHDDIDYDFSADTIESARVNPKFHFYDVLDKNRSTEKSVVRRSSDNLVDYSIVETNVSMIDETKREKVKQVHKSVHGLLMTNDSHLTDSNFLSLTSTNRFVFLSLALSPWHR